MQFKTPHTPFGEHKWLVFDLRCGYDDVHQYRNLAQAYSTQHTKRSSFDRVMHEIVNEWKSTVRCMWIEPETEDAKLLPFPYYVIVTIFPQQFLFIANGYLRVLVFFRICQIEKKDFYYFFPIFPKIFGSEREKMEQKCLSLFEICMFAPFLCIRFRECFKNVGNYHF